MMDVREKLLKLVAICPCESSCESLPGSCPDRKSSFCNNFYKLPYCAFGKLVDHLIANGVTVLPVQVGDTVYGRFRSYGKEVHQCEVVKVKACQFKDRTVRYFLDLEFDVIDPFFRDGRLMRCGMQAIYGADFGDWYRVYLTREEAEATPPEGE